MKKYASSTALAMALFWSAAAAAQTAPASAGDNDPDAAAANDADTAEGTDARDMPASSDGDIIVMAQRRNESAQRVPISLTVLDAGSIEENGVRSVLDLQRVVPSFSIQKAQQATNTRIAIRGVGSSGNTAIEPSVGAFVDGVYIARPGSLLAGLNDIASVEVLRGPQGTLFGRNASMGAVSFRTALPTREFEADVGAEYGSFDRVRLTGVLNAPVGDSVGIRLAGLFDESDGSGINNFTGGRFGESRLVSLRGTVRVDLSANLTWTLRGDYQRSTGDGQVVNSVKADTVTPAALANWTARTGGRLPNIGDTYSRSVYQYTDGRIRDRQWGVSSDLELGLGDYSLRLISAYRDWNSFQSEFDSISVPLSLFGRDVTFTSKTHSQELQLASPEDLFGFMGFVAGLYYYKEDYAIDETTDLGSDYCDTIVARAAPGRLAACRAGPLAGASAFRFDQKTEALAAFGQANFDLTDRLRLTAGIRYSHDDKSADFLSLVYNMAHLGRAADAAPDLEFKGGKVTYRLNATYEVAPDVMLFATYATGYKSGGFDAGNGAVLGRNRVFAPETTSNYEIGIKSQFLDRRVTANATLFRTDIDDFQLRSYNGVAFSVRNAGSIRQQGVEFELSTRPVEGLTLGVSGTYLDSEYTDFRNAPGLPGFGGTQDLTGQRAPTSPRWQGVVNAGYRGNLSEAGNMDFSLTTNLAFQSDSDVGGAGDNNPQGIQPGYALLGGRFSIADKDDGWEVYLAGDNLTNKGYCALIFTQPFNGPFGLNDPATGGAVQRCTLGEPRTVRIGAKIKFR